MFSFLRGKYPKKAVLTALALFLFTGLLFVSCSSDSDDSGNLNGTWNDGFANITIEASAMRIAYENNYEGDIVNSPDFSASKGVLIIKFTKYMEIQYDSSWNVTGIIEVPANNGKYGALYWNELKSGSVRMMDAYEGYTHAMCSTFDEALLSFTMDKAGNYVDWSITAPYSKK